MVTASGDCVWFSVFGDCVWELRVVTVCGFLCVGTGCGTVSGDCVWGLRLVTVCGDC